MSNTEYKAPRYVVFSIPLLGPNILLNTLFSKTASLRLCVCLKNTRIVPHREHCNKSAIILYCGWSVSATCFDRDAVIFRPFFNKDAVQILSTCTWTYSIPASQAVRKISCSAKTGAGFEDAFTVKLLIRTATTIFYWVKWYTELPIGFTGLCGTQSFHYVSQW